MIRLKTTAAALLAVGGLFAWSAAGGGSPAAGRVAAAPQVGAAADDRAAAEAAVRKRTEAFVKAANARDAKAAAALWTEHAEFHDIDGTVVRGRADLTKMYEETYKTSPKGTVDVQLEAVKVLGKNLATADGVIRFTPADGSEVEVTKFSALYARENDEWLIASARERVPDAAELVSLADLDWLIGDWEAKRDGREVRTSYSWGDDKGFIQCRFRITENGQIVAAGTEMIAKDPTTGDIRAWLFDRSGTLSESTWIKDGNRWQVVMAGTLPDGSEIGATNALVPNGKDSFTWVSVDRVAGGQPLPNVAPLKVTRVKK